MQLTGRRYDTGEYVTVEIEGSTIARITSRAGSENAESTWIAPGFVDLQVNGYGGLDFTDLSLTEQQVVEVSRAMDAMGVTGYLPTVITQSYPMQAHALKTIAAACKSSPEAACRVNGIHLEGPYISSEDGPRGAHPRQHCRPPDWDEFQRYQEAAAGRIRLLTLSPEYDGSAEFIARAVASGVVVSIGHTKATSQQIKAATDAGARLSTHLGNGAHAQIRRHPNYIWDQLAEDRLWASLIADGHHLPPAVVKSFVRCKGPQRCLLVSDITGMAGMPPGRYTQSSLGDVEVLEDGRLVVGGQRDYLVGAALPIGVGVANVMRSADVDLPTAVDMASGRPAQLIGLAPGRLEVGAAADLVQFDLPGADGHGELDQLTVRATINAGQVVHGSS